MDKQWLAELERREDGVRAAVRALLDHSGASGTRLKMNRSDRDPTYVMVCRADSIDDLDPRRKDDWQTYGPVPKQALNVLPAPVREGLEEMRERADNGVSPRKH